MGKPFAFDVQKLNKFVNGDIGIADAIHKAQITPILNAIPYPKDKDIFMKLQKPDRKAGIFAIEKTIISSMLESQKPFIELAKIFLELFGTIEVVVATLIGGPNPAADASTFAGAFAANAAQMATFGAPVPPEIKPEDVAPSIPALPDPPKTNISPTPVPPVIPAIPPAPADPPAPPEPPKPDTIFLGRYDRYSPSGNVNSTNSGPERGEFWLGQYWPQYTNINQFTTYETDKINALIVDVEDPALRKDIMDGRTQSFGDEWGKMSTNNQITEKYQNLLGGTNVGLYYRPRTIQYLNNNVDIEIEDDYDVMMDFSTDGEYNQHQKFYIYAKLKPVPPPPSASGGAANGNPPPSSGASPGNFAGGATGLLKAIKTFLKTTLKVILKKLLPLVISIQKLLSKPAEFIGEILMTKLKEHFQMFDPAIKGTPDGDKYWAGDKFVMDGIASIDAGILKMTLGIKDGLPTFKSGTTPPSPDVKEQPILKQVASFVGLPINLLKGIMDAVMALMKKLFVVPTLANTMADFVSLQWIKDLLSLPKLLEFMGAKDGDMTKIPFLAIPPAGNLAMVPSMITAFLKMVVGFLNGFISIPNTILNMELVPKIPEPA
jgi:hypothetical protein